MANLADNERYDSRRDIAHAHRGDGRTRDMGATVFIWVAWAAAAIFWGVLLTTGFGILSALGHPAANGPGPGEADMGGVGWMTINFIGGIIVLGGALAWGMYRYASRDRMMDPVTEVATHALYDTIERQGGDDMTSRSPEARTTHERDAYRTAQRDLR